MRNDRSSGRADISYAGLENPADAHAVETLELVQRAQAGDEEAFARLIQPHMRKMYYVALKITRNREDAEDVSQQAFLKALANIGQFRGGSQFSTWLTRIAINEALMSMRKRRSEDSRRTSGADFDKQMASMDSMCAEDSLQPEVLFSRGEKYRLLREAIANLRGPLRVAVWLVGIKEHKSKEAAKILNLSQTAVKVRYMRARQELRECLADRI